MIPTARLRLRCLAEADVPDLVAALNNWAIAQWLARPPFPYSADDARAFVRWSQLPAANLPPRAYAVAERRSDQLLGVVGLEVQRNSAELGYWLTPAAHGQGYMREAVTALLQHDAGRLPGAPAIYATTDPENQRSQAVLLSTGFRKIAVEARTQPNRRGSSQVLRFELPAGVSRHAKPIRWRH